jgi:hypothetical protein
MNTDDLRPTIEWQAVQSCFDEPIFTPARTAELLFAVGRLVHGNGLPPERVQEELREITANFAFNRYQELQPTTSKRDAQAAKLAQALGLALETLGFDGEPTPDDLLPMFGRGGLFAAAAMRGEPKGEAATMNAARALRLMRQDALKLREIYSKRQRMGGAQRGRQEERAIKMLARDLSALYWLTWVESPGVALTDEGQPNSPFMRLFVGVQKALQERIGEPRHEPAALAQVWHRLSEADKLKFHTTG